VKVWWVARRLYCLLGVHTAHVMESVEVSLSYWFCIDFSPMSNRLLTLFEWLELCCCKFRVDLTWWWWQWYGIDSVTVLHTTPVGTIIVIWMPETFIYILRFCLNNLQLIVSDIAIFVLKRDVKLQLTNFSKSASWETAEKLSEIFW